MLFSWLGQLACNYSMIGCFENLEYAKKSRLKHLHHIQLIRPFGFLFYLFIYFIISSLVIAVQIVWLLGRLRIIPLSIKEEKNKDGSAFS